MEPIEIITLSSDSETETISESEELEEKDEEDFIGDDEKTPIRNYDGPGAKWAKIKEMMKNRGQHQARIRKRFVRPIWKKITRKEKMKKTTKINFSPTVNVRTYFKGSQIVQTIKEETKTQPEMTLSQSKEAQNPSENSIEEEKQDAKVDGEEDCVDNMESMFRQTLGRQNKQEN